MSAARPMEFQKRYFGYLRQCPRLTRRQLRQLERMHARALNRQLGWTTWQQPPTPRRIR